MWATVGQVHSTNKINGLDSLKKKFTADYRGAQIFQKSRRNLKILEARGVEWSEFQTENSKILGSIIYNFVDQALCIPDVIIFRISHLIDH
jgi:hypothetical protein